jgi:hypothetical protein
MWTPFYESFIWQAARRRPGQRVRNPAPEADDAADGDVRKQWWRNFSRERIRQVQPMNGSFTPSSESRSATLVWVKPPGLMMAKEMPLAWPPAHDELVLGIALKATSS